MPRPGSGIDWQNANTCKKSTLTIASGDITASLHHHIIAAQAGTTDNLDGITPDVTSGSDADGYFPLLLQVDTGDTITIRHNQNAAATKNILLPGGGDIVLRSEEFLVLTYDINLDTNGAWVVVGGSVVSANAVRLPVIGTPALDDVEDLQTAYHSAGWISGGAISDAGGATINVAAGAGALRSSSSQTAQLLFFDWSSSSGLAIAADSIRYVGVEYNSGSPQVVVRTSENWNYFTDFPLGEAINEGGTLHIQSTPWDIGDHAHFMIRRMVEISHIVRDNAGGGLIFSETGTRKVVVTSGALWHGLTRFAISAINTNTGDTFTTYSAGGQEATGVTSWPNTQYDNAGTLTNLGNNKWANLWWYLELDGELVMIYGTAQYTTQAQAEAESAPSTVPNRVAEHAVLAARFIFQESAATAAEILSAFTFTFSAAGVTDHGNLAGLSDDDHPQYGEIAQVESITGLWNFMASGAGGLTDYDVTVGDVATPDYGLIRIGDGLVGRTSYKVGALDLDGAFIFRNVGGPVTGQIEFVFTESGGGAIRFALPKSGVGNATYNPRSMLLAGPAVNDDDVVTVSYWQTQGIFHNLPCDTPVSGADLGVQGSLEVENDIFTDSIKESTAAAGVTIDGLLIKDGLAAHGISSHTEHANWKALYTDGSGDEQELALGANNTVLKGEGVGSAPTFGQVTHAELGGVTSDLHHTEAHTVASHSDTTATGAELETLTDASNADALHSHAPSTLTHGLTVEDPTSSEDITIPFYTDVAITITQINDVVRGTTPSLTWNIKHDPNRSAAGNSLFAGDRTTTSESGAETTTFADATVPADSHIWFESSAESGTTDEFSVTIKYTED